MNVFQNCQLSAQKQHKRQTECFRKRKKIIIKYVHNMVQTVNASTKSGHLSSKGIENIQTRMIRSM